VAWTTSWTTTLKTLTRRTSSSTFRWSAGSYTETRVKSYAGVAGNASAEASVQVQVLVDGVAAHPGEVIFCKRTQELTALFGGRSWNCEDLNAMG